MPIARERIDPEADKVIRRLRRYGHTAYLVGGCVRDLLLDRTPKDFDIATSATPTETKDLFRNCRIIGRRFRLAHIFFGTKIIETATFRTNPREGVEPTEEEELLIRRDNVFGTAEEDARRRDFTINGLFYDIEAEEVIDYVGGLADLDARLVRTIGDPDIRFREDPIRILRAIKFAARLDFRIESITYAAILAHRDEIAKSATPRVLEEIYRLLRGGAARASLQLLLETGVAATLAPELVHLFGGTDEARESQRRLAWRLLDELDAHVQASANQQASAEPDELAGLAPNALLLATLVAPFVPDVSSDDDGRPVDQTAVVEALLRPLVARLRVSRRDAERARQILLAQRRLAPAKRRRAKPMSLLRRDHFMEALALYQLVARATGREGEEIAHWRHLWRRGHSHGAATGEALPTDVPGPRKRRRRRGGRGRKRAVRTTFDATTGADEVAALGTDSGDSTE